MKQKIVIEENKNKIIEQLAAEIISTIENSKRGKVHIALSGGNTPKAFHSYIAERYSKTVDWNKVCFWWGDERCVPPIDSESNYKMAKETILDKLNIPPKNIFRIKGEVDPNLEAKALNELVKRELPFENTLPVFDIILLGLGEDGHTASIFPNQIELFNSDKYAEVAVHPITKQKRITLTGSVINNAENVFFLVTGNSKAKVVGEIVNMEGNYKSYPAFYVNPEGGNYKWYLDKLAAKKLKQT